MTPSSASHGVGRLGITSGAGVSSDLASWRVVTQVGSPSNDVNSQPIANSNPPITTNDSLTIPAATNTPVESGGVPIAVLGLPNVDFTGLNRPAFGGAAPDIGAYEFDGVSGDFIAPSIDSVFFSPDTGVCSALPRLITAIINDVSGIDTAQILFSTNGIPQTPILMTQGTLQNSYTGTIPASGNSGVSFRIRAVDNSPNRNTGVGTLREYQDEYLSDGLSATTSTPTVFQGDSASVLVSSHHFGAFKITEVVLFRTGTGPTNPYPSFLPSANDDFIEFTNLCTGVLNLSGFSVEILGVGPRVFTFPSGTQLAGNQTLILQVGSGTNLPANNLYYTGGTNKPWSSGNAIGLIVRSQSGQVLDALALNSFVFPGSSGLSPTDWSGAGAPSPTNIAGSQLLGPDLNNATNWTATSVANPGTLGSVNQGLVLTNPLTITWTYLGSPIGNTPSIRFGPLTTLGVNTFDVTISDGVCSTSASVTVNVTFNIGFQDLPLHSEIEYYPNPVRDELTVKIGEHTTGRVTLTDLTGKVLLHVVLPDGQDRVQVDVSTLPSGVYFVHHDSDGFRSSKKLVKY